MAVHPRMHLKYNPAFPVDQLIPGVKRPESWWQEHPEFLERQVRMVADIEKNGLKYPLAVLLQKGKYRVTVGCQRLRAIKTLGWKTVPVVIASKGKFNPELHTRKQLAKLFGGKLKVCIVQPNACEIIPQESFE